jgi:ribokinase
VADVFVLGSINQDFVLSVERRAEPGETVTDAVLATHNGGKGANQATAAARLGASVLILGRVGGDEFGGPLVEALADGGVDMSLVRSVEDYHTGSAFITLTPDGENAITVAPGANRALSPRDVDDVGAEIRGSSVLVAQMEVPAECVARAVEIARESGTRAVINLAPPRELPEGTLDGLDPLVVNEHEAAFLLGGKVTGIEGARDAARRLLELGPVSVVITLGSAGAVVAQGEDADHLPAPETEVVDTTGAGDAFMGALAVKLSRGELLRGAVAYAVRVGSAAVAVAGAQGFKVPEEA